MEIITSHKTTKFWVKSWKPSVNSRKFICLHHTWAGSSAWLRDYLCYRDPADPTNYKIRRNTVSCQYYIDKEALVYKFCDDDKCCRTMGWSNYGWISDLNMHAISIEIASDWYRFTEKQKSAVRTLVNKLMLDNNISYKNIINHQMASWYRGKRDVGPNFYGNNWSAYQDTYKIDETKPLTAEDIRYLKAEMKVNSLMYDKIDNPVLKTHWHATNNFIRGMLDKFDIPY